MNHEGIFNWITQSVAASALWAALTGWLPYAVAAIPIIFYMIMIWETKTVTHLRNNWRQKHIAKRYAKLKAREKVTLAKLDALELLRTARVEARETVQHAQHEAAKLVAAAPKDLPAA